MRTERRRHSRVEVPEREPVRLELRQRVQLLDISLSGALLACEAPLPVGARGRIRAGLGADGIDAELEIRREHPGAVIPRHTGLGAAFVSMNDASRRSLEQFLRRASEEA